MLQHHEHKHENLELWRHLLATGRWTNDQDNSYHGTQKKKKGRS